MKYYVMALEQTLINGEYSEYAPTVKQYNNFKSAETYFHVRLGELANSASHSYAKLEIINSVGGVIKHDTTGEYHDEDATE